MNWEYLRSDEMKAAIEKSGGLCVIPIGCMEKHGSHLPLGTDALQARATVEKAAELEDVVVFPTGMWLGDLIGIQSRTTPEKVQRQHGGISLSPHTLLTVMEELCDEIARNGFRKILFVNAHGGNKPILNFFLRAQGYKNKNYATMVTSVGDKITADPALLKEEFLAHREDYPMVTDEDLEVLQAFADKGGYGGGHGHASETLRILAAYPELVAADRYEAEDGSSTHRSDYLKELGVECKGAWGANYPNCLSGFPSTGCTHTLGVGLVLYSARRLANIYKVLKKDEECVRIATGK